MAAVIEFRPTTAPALDGPARRPALRVIEGGRSPAVRRLRRTYLRRRLAVVAVAAAIVVVAVQLVSGLIGPPVVAAPASVPATHVVGSGETMWSVAGELAPQLDRRVAVDALVAANGGSERLQVGDVLEVPAALRRGA